MHPYLLMNLVNWNRKNLYKLFFCIIVIITIIIIILHEKANDFYQMPLTLFYIILTVDS